MRSIRSAARIRAVGLAGLVAAAVAAAGCARPVGSVTGTVAYMGVPLKGGSVTFVSTEGRASAATTIAGDGTFSLDPVAAGSYKVCVDTAYLKAPSAGPAVAGFAGKAAGPPAGAVLPDGYVPSNPGELAAVQAARRYVPIPAKYADPDRTDLSVRVTGTPGQTYDIPLQ